MVLNHLSEAAGFIILLETEISGKVDVWSNQPLTKDEAVDLLNTILNQKGYAAIRNGRTLRIVRRDVAKTQDIPVRSGSDPLLIPKSDEMVTQIIPVRYANALQLIRDLQPLLPDYATLTANESGNALVLTDTLASIRRMAEIVAALDTSISSISTIRVFQLRHADAKQLAEAIKALFEVPQTGRGGERDRREEFMSRFRGGDGGGGGGNNGQPQGTGRSEARQAASRVVAVPDERINALVVSAPDEFIPAIEQLVREVDVGIADITELRVFPLRNADPQEMATILAGLFPDPTANQTESGGFRFNRGPFGDGGGSNRGNRGGNAASETSERSKLQSRVIAVPDLRTSSLIVSAAGEMMPQIAAMIDQLDTSSAKKQKVFVYSLENADVLEVEQILRGLFERSTQGNRSATTDTSPLSTRSQANQNTGTIGGIGSSGIGGTGGTGGGTGGQPFR
jgi:general secretion pathway protein D